MNLCFIIGKIISEVEFDFIINSKNISIIIFEIELEDKVKVRVKGYNEIADYCYQQLKTNDNISIQGLLNSNGEIEIQEIDKVEGINIK